MKKVMNHLFVLILLATSTFLSAQTCVNVTSLSSLGTDRNYANTVSPNGVTYLSYKYLSGGEPVSIQGNTFEATSKGFIMKLDKFNNFEWIQRVGTDSDNYLEVYSIVSDQNDNCFIHAQIFGTSVFAGYTFSSEKRYLTHVLIKLNASGELMWVSHFTEGRYLLDDGAGDLYLYTTFDGVNNFVFKGPNADTTVIACYNSQENAIFAINKDNGMKHFFTRLGTYIGNDNHQGTNCKLFRVNDLIYLSAYYEVDNSPVNKILSCSQLGEIVQKKNFDGKVVSLFDSPADNSVLYCHVLLSDGKYHTQKYSSDFSTLILEKENTKYEIFTSQAYDHTQNYFVDNNGDITAIINPYTPNYFTYDGESVYENNTKWYALVQFSPDLELLNFKPIIPGWSNESYSALYSLPNSNMFKLIGYGSITNEIDTVSYASDGSKSDVFIFDFLNNANITNPEIALTDTLLELEVEAQYQLTYTIKNGDDDETVKWFSLDSQVVSVSDDGLLTAMSEGKASIVAQINGTDIFDLCSVTVSPKSALAEVMQSSIRIFPNPIANYVSFDANSLISKVEVYNLAGKKVLETSKAGRINVSNLSMGMYFFKVSSNNQQFTYKMFKK